MVEVRERNRNGLFHLTDTVYYDMNIIINSAERETRRPMTDSWIFLPASGGFIHGWPYSNISSHIQAR